MKSLFIRHSLDQFVARVSSALRRGRSSASSAAPSRVCALLPVVSMALAVSAQPSRVLSPAIRSPLGVYVHVNVPDVIQHSGGPQRDRGCAQTTQDIHGYLRCFFAKLLADTAISGITAGLHWDQIQLDNPL